MTKSSTAEQLVKVLRQAGVERVYGFAVAASKLVLTGGVRRMLELARSNVRKIPRASLVR
jgi:hypothetical protein